MDLQQLREEIDATDREMLELFKKRTELVRSVGRYKLENGLPIFQPEREQELLSKVDTLAGEEIAPQARVLFGTLMDLSKSEQQREFLCGEITSLIKNAKACTPKSGAKVACQGVAGAYSFRAARHMVQSPDITCCGQFEDVFKLVESGQCDYGVLPLQNSTAGSVTQVYDLMNTYGFYVVGSYNLRINHCLLGTANAEYADVRTVCTHPQALNQCSDFFRENPHISQQLCSNTAAAAKLVADSRDNTLAAIAGKDCCELYGLKLLKEDIQNERNNYTRFVLISREIMVAENANRISVVLRLPHVAGALSRLALRIAAAGVNLTKIESRPIPNEPFEFTFYFDMEGSPREERVVSLLEQLSAELKYFKLLGCYYDENSLKT